MGAVRWKHGVSGDWADAGDWRGGKVPGAADNVVVAGGGDYTLTIHSTEAAKALTLDAAGAVIADTAAFDLGTMFSIEAGTFKVSHGGSVDGGTVSIGAAGHVLGSGGSLDAAVVDSGTLKAASGTLTIGGMLTGAGRATVGSGATLDLAGGANFGGDVGGAGTLLVSGSGFATLTGVVAAAAIVADYNSGLDLTAGGTLSDDISGAGTLFLDGSSSYTMGPATDLAIGELGIGTELIADGGTIGGTIIGGGTISVTSGTLIADGAFDYGGTLSIAAGATLESNDGGTLSAGIYGGGTLVVGGTAPLDMIYDVPVQTAVDLEYGATLECSAIFSGAVTDNGTIACNGSFLTLLDLAGGTGTLQAFENQSVNLLDGATLSEVITGSGTLALEQGAYSLPGGILEIANVDVYSNGTLSGNGTVAGSLVVAGVVDVSGGTLVTDGLVSFDSPAGTISVNAGSVLDVSAGASLSAQGNAVATLSGAGTLELSATTQYDGNVFGLDFGTLSIANVLLDSGSVLLGAGVVEGAVDNNGQVMNQGGTLSLAGSVSGTGQYINGYQGLVTDFLGGGTLSGTFAGGGTFLLGSDISVSDLLVYSSTIVQTADLTIASGGGFGDGDAVAYDIEAAANTTISLGYQGNGYPFDNGTDFVASGAGTENVAVSFSNSSTASVVSGTLAFLGAVYNGGVMDAAAGVMIIAQEVDGIGTLQVDATGTLALEDGTTGGQVMDFLAGSGLLDLSNPTSFAGTISGFGGSDVIDLLKTAETGFSYGGGVLTVKDGGQIVASLHFDGNYTKADFVLASDGSGGTAIRFA